MAAVLKFCSQSLVERSHAARICVLAGRSTKPQFVKVYGPKGPTMTWAQRAKAGVEAKHFQEVLKAKS